MGVDLVAINKILFGLFGAKGICPFQGHKGIFQRTSCPRISSDSFHYAPEFLIILFLNNLFLTIFPIIIRHFQNGAEGHVFENHIFLFFSEEKD
jgi:hypothetical protein